MPTITVKYLKPNGILYAGINFPKVYIDQEKYEFNSINHTFTAQVDKSECTLAVKDMNTIWPKKHLLSIPGEEETIQIQFIPWSWWLGMVIAIATILYAAIYRDYEQFLLVLAPTFLYFGLIYPRIGYQITQGG